MKITKFMKRERSGLAFTTLELAKYEERFGNEVCIKEPNGQILSGENHKADLYTIHPQLDPACYFDNAPRLMYMHGEPLSSVGNGISMAAVRLLGCGNVPAVGDNQVPLVTLILK